MRHIKNNLLSRSSHVYTRGGSVGSFGNWKINSDTSTIDFLIAHGLFSSLCILCWFKINKRKSSGTSSLKNERCYYLPIQNCFQNKLLYHITCSRHQSLQIFEFFIGPKNIFDQRKMFSCPASINKNKDLENWISNIWRLWCREQVNTVQNPVKRSDIIICFRIRLINFTKLSSNKIFRNEMLTVF